MIHYIFLLFMIHSVKVEHVSCNFLTLIPKLFKNFQKQNLKTLKLQCWVLATFLATLKVSTLYSISKKNDHSKLHEICPMSNLKHSPFINRVDLIKYFMLIFKRIVSKNDVFFIIFKTISGISIIIDMIYVQLQISCSL